MQRALKMEGNAAISSMLSRRLQEGGFLVFTALGIFLFVALLSYQEVDPGWSKTAETSVSMAKAAREGAGGTNAVLTPIQNAAGKTGAYISDLLLTLFGYLAFLFPLMIVYAGICLFQNRLQASRFHQWLWILRGLGFVSALAAGCGLASLHFSIWNHHLPSAGGILGQVVGGELQPAFGFLGATLLMISIFLAGITLATGLSWFGLMTWLKSKIQQSWSGIKISLKKILSAIFWLGNLFLIFRRRKKSALQVESSFFKSEKAFKTEKIFKNEKIGFADEIVKRNKNGGIKKMIEPSMRSNWQNLTGFEEEESNLTGVLTAERQPEKKERKISEFKSELKLVKKENKKFANNTGAKILPTVELLEINRDIKGPKAYSKTKLEALSQEVEARLLEFGVHVSVVGVYPGPVITRFELELAAGVKVAKISSLSKDLARALSVSRVRVVEVIPGKSVVGLEIPNEDRELVRFREILESQAYQESSSPLSLALGKDISGQPMVVNLAKMPHLLVAGTTGSGKSVGVNAMLLSLLFKATPEEIRLILIDPKMLELSIYDGIPHLLTPVVTDMKDAANALRWCVMEMERRYQIMAALGVRNVLGYNRKLELAESEGKPLLHPLWKPGMPGEVDQEGKETAPVLKRFPYVVVIIDEFADMMMVVGKKVEELIARIAQKARAAGIHMILATQRPSVDVITGLIKANVPTRIAYQVSSRIDSRTILDQQGAEQLLGHGDMLYLEPGSGIPLRIHGAFVSDEEVHAVVKSLKEMGEPDYEEDILGGLSKQPGPLGAGSQIGFSGYGFEEKGEGEQDELYDESVKIVIETRRASISHLQRRLKIGYNRAARLIETMEEQGVVSPMQANGNREVLVMNMNEDN